MGVKLASFSLLHHWLVMMSTYLNAVTMILYYKQL